MEELPKFVSGRLAAQQGSEDHPDADLLTAFSESSLGQRERQNVLAHLAKCARCRQVLALALPAPAQEAVAATAPARGWFALPALRWAAVAAVVIIAAGSILISTRRSSSPSTQVTREVAAVSRQSEATADQASAAKTGEPPAAATAAREEQKKKSKPLSFAARSMGHPAEPATVADAEKGSAEGVGQMAKAQAPPAAAADKKQALAGANRTEAYSSEFKAKVANAVPPLAESAKNIPPGSASSSLTAQARSIPAAPPPAGSVSDQSLQGQSAPARDRLGTAGPAGIGGGTVGGVAGGVAAAAPRPAEARPQTAPNATSRAGAVRRGLTPASDATLWRISDLGALERSPDNGGSWQRLPIGNGSAFRAVAKVGRDVWAGGAGGALYHSDDAGANWKRIYVGPADHPITDEIVSLEFLLPRSGTVTTAGHEVWVTRDGGQSWSRVR